MRYLITDKAPRLIIAGKDYGPGDEVEIERDDKWERAGYVVQTPAAQAPPVPLVPPADAPPAVENPKPKRGRKPREEAPSDAAQPVPDEDNDAPAEA